MTKGVARAVLLGPVALRPHRRAAHRQRHRRDRPGPRRSRHLPTLRTDRLVAGFLYYDARADDARLTLTVARTAALDHGAVVANYAAVDRARHRRRGAG